LDEARKQIADLQAEIHELRSQLNRNYWARRGTERLPLIFVRKRS